MLNDGYAEHIVRRDTCECYLRYGCRDRADVAGLGSDVRSGLAVLDS
ncbi:MAG: hypothetical protein ACLTDF_09415 [Coprococcus sp.]